jgi:hypothetical protein
MGIIPALVGFLVAGSVGFYRGALMLREPGRFALSARERTVTVILCTAWCLDLAYLSVWLISR